MTVRQRGRGLVARGLDAEQVHGRAKVIPNPQAPPRAIEAPLTAATSGRDRSRFPRTWSAALKRLSSANAVEFDEIWAAADKAYIKLASPHDRSAPFCLYKHHVA